MRSIRSAAFRMASGSRTPLRTRAIVASSSAMSSAGIADGLSMVAMGFLRLDSIGGGYHEVGGISVGCTRGMELEESGVGGPRSMVPAAGRPLLDRSPLDTTALPRHPRSWAGRWTGILRHGDDRPAPPC